MELEGAEPVELGHDDVQEDEVERALLEFVECVVAVFGLADLVAHFLEATGQHLAVHGIVVDDKNAASGERALLHARKSKNGAVWTLGVGAGPRTASAALPRFAPREF